MLKVLVPFLGILKESASILRPFIVPGGFFVKIPIPFAIYLWVPSDK